MGLDATSMRDVARVAGMRPASIYHHSAGKETILEELRRGFLVPAVRRPRCCGSGPRPFGSPGAVVQAHIRLHATRATVALVQDMLHQGVRDGVMQVPSSRPRAISFWPWGRASCSGGALMVGSALSR